MAVDSIARMLAADASDIAEQAMKAIIEFPQGFTYKGEVDYFSDLPTTGNTVGDVYTVKYKGSSGTEPSGDEYVWGKYQGVEQWILRNNLSQYAKIDGSYILMNVGTSDNLVDKKAVGSLQSPFFFRPTAGDVISINGESSAQIKSIHGKTLVWNQLVKSVAGKTQNGVTFVNNGDGTYTVYTDDNGATANTTLDLSGAVHIGLGHKICIYGCPAGGSSNGYSIADTWNGQREYGEGLIYTLAASPTVSIVIRIASGTKIPSTSPVTFQPQSFDLTAIFGAGNEPSRVAEFRSEYQLSHYDYSAPRMLNFAGTGIKSVGFNQLDPETGKMPVIANKQYQIVGTYTEITSDSEGAITPDSDGYFTPTLPGILTVTGATTSTCVHLVHSGYRDDETEAYWSETRQLPTATYFPTGMKSAGSVYDELTPDKAITRIASINLHDATWVKNSDHQYYHAFTEDEPGAIRTTTSPFNVACSARYTPGSAYDGTLTDRSICTTALGVWIYDEAETGSTPALIPEGATLYYPVGTPTETPIDPPLNLSYRVADFGTEEVIAPNGDAPTTSPIVMKAHYNRDYTRQLDNIMDNIGDGAEAGALAESAQSVNAGRLIMGGFNSDDEATLNDSQIRAAVAKIVVEAIYNTPTADGVYMFKATVTDGEATFSWEAAE